VCPGHGMRTGRFLIQGISVPNSWVSTVTPGSHRHLVMTVSGNNRDRDLVVLQAQAEDELYFFEVRVLW
jgi:hypothetical protein